MISIVIPISGISRLRNFNACMECIKKQTYKDYEIIVVEQKMNQPFYYEHNTNNIYYTWYGVFDRHNRGYNLSWGRNIGALKAKGEIVVLLDTDFIFTDNYFELISKMKTVFAAGAENYVWGSDIITEEYFQTRDITVFQKNFHKLRSFGKIYGEGSSLVFNREWYFNTFGGYNETYAGWACEDNEGAWRIRALLNKTDEQIERIPIDIIHLYHTHDISAANKNKQLFENYKTKYDPIQLSNLIKNTGVGDLGFPKYIS